MRRGDSIRKGSAVVVLATALLVGSATSAAALIPGSAGRCVEPAPAPRGSTVRDLVAAPADDPLASASRAPRASQAEPVTIPVAIHVLAIDQTPEGGWVSDQQLGEQLDVLDASFAGESGGAASRFTFELQSVDRTIKERWFFLTSGSRAERRMKEELRTGGKDTLNVYVADLQGGMLGWATYPWRVEDNRVGDAVMVDFQALPGGAKAAYDEGDTLVHEVGHWLGLFHTFEGGCDGDGDAVADTPAEASPSYSCPDDRDTCPADGPDPVTNFMDYSPDACMVAFTQGQVDRMSAAWDAYRA